MKFLFLCLSGAFLFSACSKNDGDAQQNDKASVQMFLTDAPANYDAVYLSVKSIEINSNVSGDEGWITYPINPLSAPINILEYRNGKVYTMGEPYALPAGKIEQIRLVLNATGNRVVEDGVSYDLTVPSGTQSGLKINFRQELEPDGVYKIWLDYNVVRSIHKTGNGKYMMKPVIKAFSELSNGQILGYVKPAEALTVVHAIQGVDTVASAIPAADGYFKFIGLTAGIYNISFDAVDATGYKDVTKPAIAVLFGKATDLGTTILVK